MNKWRELMAIRAARKYIINHSVDLGGVKLPYENLVFKPTKEGRNE